VDQIDDDLFEKILIGGCVGYPGVGIERSAALFVCGLKRRVAELVVARRALLLYGQIFIVVDAGVVLGGVECEVQCVDLCGRECGAEVRLDVREVVDVVYAREQNFGAERLVEKARPRPDACIDELRTGRRRDVAFAAGRAARGTYAAFPRDLASIVVLTVRFNCRGIVEVLTGVVLILVGQGHAVVVDSIEIVRRRGRPRAAVDRLVDGQRTGVGVLSEDLLEAIDVVASDEDDVVVGLDDRPFEFDGAHHLVGVNNLFLICVIRIDCEKDAGRR
jgi:hypothetical protein